VRLLVQTDCPRDISVRQGPRRCIFASFTRRQGYPILRWSVLQGFSSTNLTTCPQLFFDDEIRNKEVESLGKRPVTWFFASGTGTVLKG